MFLGLNNHVRETKAGPHHAISEDRLRAMASKRSRQLFRENATDGSVLNNLSERNQKLIGCGGVGRTR
jgi:hypothetical protein